MSSRFSRLRLMVTFFAMIAAVTVGLGQTAAQDPVETEPLTVSAVLCEDATCETLGDRVGDVTVSAIDTTSSEVLASCLTVLDNQVQGCTLDIPTGADYTLEWDITPEGYTFFGELIPVAGDPGPPVTYIPFIPVAAETETMLVNAATCVDQDCTEFADWLVDFEIRAYDETTSELLDTCLTDAGSQGNICELTVPVDASVVFEWDAALVPAGFEFDRVIISDGEMGPIVNTLAFRPTTAPVTETPTYEPTEVPTHEPTIAPTNAATTTPAATSTAIAGLPSTGSIGDSGSSSTGLLVLTSGVLLAGILAFGAIRLRTR